MHTYLFYILLRQHMSVCIYIYTHFCLCTGATNRMARHCARCDSSATVRVCYAQPSRAPPGFRHSAEDAAAAADQAAAACIQPSAVRKTSSSDCQQHVSHGVYHKLYTYIHIYIYICTDSRCMNHTYIYIYIYKCMHIYIYTYI